MMLVAFYHYPTGKEFYKVLHHKLVCWWTHGDYSHCELVLGQRIRDDGVIEYECASSSFRDKGVRSKWMELPASKWTIVDIGDMVSEDYARAVLTAHMGDEYDKLAWLGHLWRPIIGSADKWTCSEFVAYMLNMYEPWRYDPATLFAVLVSHGRIVQMCEALKSKTPILA